MCPWGMDVVLFSEYKVSQEEETEVFQQRSKMAGAASAESRSAMDNFRYRLVTVLAQLAMTMPWFVIS
jgi:hypothetical protein